MVDFGEEVELPSTAVVDEVAALLICRPLFSRKRVQRPLIGCLVIHLFAAVY